MLKSNNKLLLQIILFCSGFAVLSAGHTEEEVRYYDFEIIIFESLDPQGKISEVWKRDSSREVPETFVVLNQPYPGPIPKNYNPKYTFKYLPTSSLQLRQEAQLLEESKNYKVLVHTSWRQPGMAEEVALPIHIIKRFNTQPANIFSNTQNPDMPAVNLPQPVNPPVQQQSILDGYIKIVLKRYLHAHFDLLYTAQAPVVISEKISETNNPATAENNPEQPDEIQNQQTIQYQQVVFRLDQTRKMRSKEVHYLDHPVLGVLILATPFNPEES